MLIYCKDFFFTSTKERLCVLEYGSPILCAWAFGAVRCEAHDPSLIVSMGQKQSVFAAVFAIKQPLSLASHLADDTVQQNRHKAENGIFVKL